MRFYADKRFLAGDLGYVKRRTPSITEKQAIFSIFDGLHPAFAECSQARTRATLLPLLCIFILLIKRHNRTHFASATARRVPFSRPRTEAEEHRIIVPVYPDAHFDALDSAAGFENVAVNPGPASEIPGVFQTTEFRR